MSRAINTPALVWHCTAGFSGVRNIESFWHRPTAQGGLGWNAKGYGAIIELNGTIWYLHRNDNQIGGYSTEYSASAFEFVTNGVRGFNRNTVNFATIGGVEQVGTKWVPKDTRTDEQKASQLILTQQYFDWLNKNGGNVTRSKAFGHRDFSKDTNGNGVIDSWERIKECPSYDVVSEFGWLFVTKYNRLDLPNP